MRFRELLQEALRNISTGSSRAGILVIIVVVASTCLIVLDVAGVGTLEDRAREVREGAGGIRVLVGENNIDPIACSNLDQLAIVSDAGPVWQLDPLRLSALPRVEIPVFQLSPGVARMLDFPTVHAGGIYLPESLADRWHARAGSRLETAGGDITIDGVFRYSDEDGRDPRLTNAVVVVGDKSEHASECWYDVWPPTNRSDQFAYGAVAPSGEGAPAPQVAPLNPTVGQRFDFAGDYASRATAFASPAVVILFALVAFGGISRRRLQLAGTLHAGARRRDLVAGIGVETFLWAAPAAIATFVFTRFAVKVLLSDMIYAYEASLAVTLPIAAVAAILGAVIPAATTREDRLFELFKSRG